MNSDCHLVRGSIIRILIYGAVDYLYQKIAIFLKSKKIITFSSYVVLDYKYGIFVTDIAAI